MLEDLGTSSPSDRNLFARRVAKNNFLLKSGPPYTLPTRKTRLGGGRERERERASERERERARENEMRGQQDRCFCPCTGDLVGGLRPPAATPAHRGPFQGNSAKSRLETGPRGTCLCEDRLFPGNPGKEPEVAQE